MRWVQGLAAAVLAFSVEAAAARETIAIAGSSAVAPRARELVERFGAAYPGYAVIVEFGGSSGGLRRFCGGVGADFIDIAMTTRRMRDREVRECADNGVTDYVELFVGAEAYAFIQDVRGPELDLRAVDVYRAIAAEIVVDGAPRENPHATWSDVRAGLPATPITFFLPSPGFVSFNLFEQELQIRGCRDAGDYDVYLSMGLSARDARDRCATPRLDGFVTVAGDYNGVLGRVASDPSGVGLVSVAFLEELGGDVRAIRLEGAAPSRDAAGPYPLAGPQYFYVKAAHLDVIPGLREFVRFAETETAAGR